MHLFELGATLLSVMSIYCRHDTGGETSFFTTCSSRQDMAYSCCASIWILS